MYKRYKYAFRKNNVRRITLLLENLNHVKNKIAEALSKRTEPKETGDTVTLVAVTKNHEAQVITDIQALGVMNIGENRVQEAKHKQEDLGHNGTWHLIGHLQTNKVKQAVELFDIIESVDSSRLLEAINTEAEKKDKVQDILLQINIAGEEQKSGFSPDEYEEIKNSLDAFKSIRIRGIMVIAPLTLQDAEEARPIFKEAYQYFCQLKGLRSHIDYLSMGMSGDYHIAIEEGANLVRLGTTLFGERDYSKN